MYSTVHRLGTFLYNVNTEQAIILIRASHFMSTIPIIYPFVFGFIYAEQCSQCNGVLRVCFMYEYVLLQRSVTASDLLCDSSFNNPSITTIGPDTNDFSTVNDQCDAQLQLTV